MNSSKRTIYAQEIQRRIIDLDLPLIGRNVFVRQVDKPGATEVKPCVEISRGPQADREAVLNSGVKLITYYYNVLVKTTVQTVEGSDDLDHWYESIEQHFHGVDWDQDTFQEVIGTTVNPAQPQSQESTEYQLLENGLTISVTFHKSR